MPAEDVPCVPLDSTVSLQRRLANSAVRIKTKKNANQNEGLRGEDAVCKRHARVAKVSHAKDRRPQDCQRHDKGRRGCKHRSATYGNPEQQRKDEGHGQRRCPRPLRNCHCLSRS